jgi:hypothetical protein
VLDVDEAGELEGSEVEDDVGGGVLVGPKVLEVVGVSVLLVDAWVTDVLELPVPRL